MGVIKGLNFHCNSAGKIRYGMQNKCCLTTPALLQWNADLRYNHYNIQIQAPYFAHQVLKFESKTHETGVCAFVTHKIIWGYALA